MGRGSGPPPPPSEASEVLKENVTLLSSKSSRCRGVGRGRGRSVSHVEEEKHEERRSPEALPPTGDDDPSRDNDTCDQSTLQAHSWKGIVPTQEDEKLFAAASVKLKEEHLAQVERDRKAYEEGRLLIVWSEKVS